MQTRVFAPHERPEVEVEVAGTWFYATLRMWKREPDGWVAQVTWSAPDGHRIDDFPASRVRPLDPAPDAEGDGVAPPTDTRG